MIQHFRSRAQVKPSSIERAMKHVVVAGGGIAGVCAAWALSGRSARDAAGSGRNGRWRVRRRGGACQSVHGPQSQRRVAMGRGDAGNGPTAAPGRARPLLHRPAAPRRICSTGRVLRQTGRSLSGRPRVDTSRRLPDFGTLLVRGGRAVDVADHAAASRSLQCHTSTCEPSACTDGAKRQRPSTSKPTADLTHRRRAHRRRWGGLDSQRARCHAARRQGADRPTPRARRRFASDFGRRVPRAERSTRRRRQHVRALRLPTCPSTPTPSPI